MTILTLGVLLGLRVTTLWASIHQLHRELPFGNCLGTATDGVGTFCKNCSRDNIVSFDLVGKVDRDFTIIGSVFQIDLDPIVLSKAKTTFASGAFA